jgi:hypothetical protein
VHTYTFTSPFMEGELDALSASPLGNQETGLRVYIRDKTHYAPIPRYSRFPFGIPSSFPHTGILGSLIYQLAMG